MSSAEERTEFGRSRVAHVQRALAEWWGSDTSIASHPARYFERLLSGPRLGLVQSVLASAAGRPLSPAEHQQLGKILLPAPHYVALEITAVKPQSAWPNDHVEISFRVVNRFLASTSGVVAADITQGPQSILLSTFTGGANIENLAPGDSTTGTITLRNWRTDKPEPGRHNVWLQYWVEDPDGTITVVYNFDLNIIKTYSSISIASAEIDIYPRCKPDGPDFIEIDMFKVQPSQLYTEQSGKYIAPGQILTLDWSVKGGGFPPTPDHPGSISSVTLAASQSDAKFQRPPVGQLKLDYSNVGVTTPYVMVQADLHAKGNCGEVTRSVSVPALPPYPVIVSFSPNAKQVVAGKQIALYWGISNFPWKKPGRAWLELETLDPNQKRLDAIIIGSPGKNAPAKGSIIVKPAQHTIYRLTAWTSAQSGGYATYVWKDTEVFVVPGPSPEGSWFYFKVEKQDDEYLPCYTDAEFAADKDTALANATNRAGPDYTVTEIDEAEYIHGC